VETIYNYRTAGKFLLHSFVVMPDHMHLLLTPAAGMTLEKTLQLIKGGFSYRVKKELLRNYEVWQRGFTDRRVRDATECAGMVGYIHQNPVKAKLVQRAEEYEFSSANRKFEVDELPEYLRG
jgi:putative transposase